MVKGTWNRGRWTIFSPERAGRPAFWQTTGMDARILPRASLDWRVPDFSPLSRRQKHITVQTSNRRARSPLNLLGTARGSSSPAMEMACAQAWPATATPISQGSSGAGHGHRRHPRRGIHRRCDKGDSPVLPQLLDQLPSDEPIGTATGDGASTRAVATLRSLNAAARRSCPSARAADEGGRTVLPPKPVTSPSKSRHASAEPPGDGGPAITSEVGSRRR